MGKLNIVEHDEEGCNLESLRLWNKHDDAIRKFRLCNKHHDDNIGSLRLWNKHHDDAIWEF
jgi:hypothetical protein